MTENPIAGTVPVVLKGKEYTLQFTWAAVAQVIQEYGQDRDLFDPAILASVCATGLQAHHPGMTAKDVQDGAPISKVMAAVTRALHVAYFGEAEAPAEAGEDPPENPPGTGRRANRKAPSAPSPAPSAPATEPASAPPSSGP